MKLIVLICSYNSRTYHTYYITGYKNLIAMITNTKMFLTIGFWVRVFIIATAAFIFIQKDINFQVNFQSPLNEPIEGEQPKEAGGGISSDQELSDHQSESSSPSLRGLSASLFGLVRKVSQDKEIPVKKQPSLQDANEEQIEVYISRFSNVAVSEMRKFGIPASIILANSLIQSSAGQTDFSKTANNHFRLLCDASWDGMMKDYDGTCYRKYESAWAGFRDHSRYISQNFGPLKKHGSKDYKSWAKGLEQKSFAKQKGLSKKLISTIEKYDLNRFDKK